MRCKSVVTFVLFLFFLGFCLSAITLWSSSFGWHDQQRIAQLFFLIACSLSVFFLPQAAFSYKLQVLLAGLFVLGFASVLLAQWPTWALQEWARYLGLSLLVLTVCGLAQRSWWSELVLWALALVGGVHAFQFLVFYSAAFISGIRLLDAYLLFSGFSNPRFFGQLQVMLLPVLALLLTQCWHRQLKRVAALLLFLMVVQWCIAIVLGGRGLWLGLLLSHVSLVLLNRNFWRLFAWQATAAVFGLLFYFLLFKSIPYWVGLEPILSEALRTGLSGRELLWQWAWDMALANPWLGAGPMHFAATYNPIAAHPHQVILQWLAEWGFAATSLALVLVAWGLVKGAAFLRHSQADVLDGGLWCSIVGSLVLAQVDGVFVMPYTETWLAILIGLAMARCHSMPLIHSRRQVFSLIAVIPVVLVLGRVLIVQAPALPASEKTYLMQYGADWAPRFWQQGWISR